MKIYRILNVLIAFIWLVNGIYCKVLNFVPRHQEIVGEILGDPHSRLFTVLIGIGETLMAIWVFSRYRSRYSAILQIILVGVMNILEFMLVPDLLLWGRWNAFFALLFMLLIYINEFQIKSKNA